MDDYGRNFIGPLDVDSVSTIPAWGASDERRLVYTEDTHKLYIGKDSAWSELSTTDHTHTHPVSISISYESGSKPAASTIIAWKAPFAFTLPQNLTDSQYNANAAPTSEVVVTIKVNGTSKGTMTVSGSGSTATFVFANAVNIAKTDVITFCFPEQDATWAGVHINLLGSR